MNSRNRNNGRVINGLRLADRDSLWAAEFEGREGDVGAGGFGSEWQDIKV
jgi:hypothetical protein